MNLSNVFRYFLYVLIYQFLISKSHQCGYTITNISQIVTGINITVPSTGFIPRSASATNLRIFFEYMDSFYSLSDAAAIKRDVMEPARLSLQSAITVNNPTNGVLRVDRQCSGLSRKSAQNIIGCADSCVASTVCNTVVVPDKYLNKCTLISATGDVTYSGTEGSGEPNVDIVILVTSTSCSGNLIAYAGSCFQERTLDRPILGIINLCPGKVAAGPAARDNILVIKHELIHALGFGVDKFAFYRNPDGSPIVARDAFGRPAVVSNYGFYMWNEKVIVQVTRSRSSVSMNYNRQFYAFVLPNVVAVAREHFNCPSINEVELEDYGELTSRWTHFDQYVVNNEIMTAVSYGWNMRFSKFTLALLKDSGWYDVDYSKAEPLDYGRNAGCILPQKGCYAYMESQRQLGNSIDPFCDVASGQTLQCDSTKKFYQYCDIRQYTSVDATVQYFKSVKGGSSYNPSLFAGSSAYSEYCPMKIAPAYTFEGVSSDCTDTNNNGISNSFTQLTSSYGPYSLCFDTSRSYLSRYGATCINYNYNGNNNNYELCVEGQKATCSNTNMQTILTNTGSLNLTCNAFSFVKQNNFGASFTCPLPPYTTPKSGYLNRCSKLIFAIIFMKMYFF